MFKIRTSILMVLILCFSVASFAETQNTNIEKYAIHLQSKDSKTQRRYAKMVYNQYPENEYLLEIVNSQLLKGYLVNLRDKYHRDAMAWFCRILGNSYNAKYIETLKTIINTRCCTRPSYNTVKIDKSRCTATKIKRYAKKSLKILKSSIGLTK